MSPRPRAAGRAAPAPANSRGRPLTGPRALRVLKDVAEALNSASTEHEAAGEALRRMAELIGLETGWVWLRDPATGRFYSAAAQSLPPYLQEPVHMTGESCRCLDLFATGRLTPRNIDVVACTRLAPAARSQDAALTGGLRCHASVALHAGAQPLGVMNLAMRGWRRLTGQELDLLATVADQLAVAVARARFAGQSIERARAEERARLARDVHDTLAQGLTAVALHIESGLAAMPPRARARAPLRRALDIARGSLDEARRAIGALRAPALRDRPLGAALAALARQFTADTGIRVRAEVADVGPIAAAIEGELFRIAGEALTNVRKHARARQALLRLDMARRRLRLTIADDGRGFRLRGARRRGFGLSAMEDRARAAGGRAVIRTRPGRGTIVTVSVPWRAA